ncbi:MAG: hypothetical protein KJ971_00600 [Firmicutes bacterium]|nr:hypothetical protein [Bacillota bacterium]
MKSSEKDFPSKLRDLGLSVIKKAKKGIEHVKTGFENVVLEEHLKRRFNLENPYKFLVTEKEKKATLVEGLLPKNAKRYEEDDLFVFYGSLEENGFKTGDIVKDLSINAEFVIKKILEVKVPVEYENKSYEVIGTAVVCDAL